MKTATAKKKKKQKQKNNFYKSQCTSPPHTFNKWDFILERISQHQHMM